MKTCPICKTNYPEGVNFCEGCGSKLEKSSYVKFIIGGAILLVIIVLLFWFLPGGSDPNPPIPIVKTDMLKKIKEKGFLCIGVEPEAPPMNFIDSNNKRQGFDYELAQQLAFKLGVNGNVIVKEADYSEIPNLLKKDSIDIIMGGYVADPSLDSIIWSDGYLDFGLCLIVKRGSAVKSISQLRGKSIGIWNDEVANEWVVKSVKDYKEIKKFEYTGWLGALDSGKVDAVIYDYPFSVEEVKEFEKLRIVQLNLNDSYYSLGVLKENETFLDTLNSAIENIKKEPIYAELVKKYFKSDAIDVAEVPETAKIYIVKEGDCFWNIAKDQLGKAERWTEIWELNKSRLPNQWLIVPGAQLIMP